MRCWIAIGSIVLVVVPAIADSAPARACEQVSALVDAAARSVLVGPATPTPGAIRFAGQLRACLTSHSICSVVSNAQSGNKELVTAELTGALPSTILPEHGNSTAAVVVRSIPRVRNDANQYCLVADNVPESTPQRQWNVYGWVIPPNSRQPLPLQKQALDLKPASGGQSLRAVAAALWFFAERMSGQR